MGTWLLQDTAVLSANKWSCKPSAVMDKVILQEESSQRNKTFGEEKIEMKLKHSQYQILHAVFLQSHKRKKENKKMS